MAILLFVVFGLLVLVQLLIGCIAEAIRGDQ